MKWRVRKPGSKVRLKYKKLKRWHLWFAWYPVRVPTKGRMSKQHKIWFAKVYRKGKRCSDYEGGYFWTWQYKEKL